MRAHKCGQNPRVVNYLGVTVKYRHTKRINEKSVGELKKDLKNPEFTRENLEQDEKILEFYWNSVHVSSALCLTGSKQKTKKFKSPNVKQVEEMEQKGGETRG